MQSLPHVTTEGENGPFFTVEFAPWLVIQVSPPHFEKAAALCAKRHCGKYYELAGRIDNGNYSVFIKNINPASLEQIDRDDAWHRRQELASSLFNMLGDETRIDPASLKRHLPLTLLTLLYREAFSAAATNDDVLKTFNCNTQTRIEEKVASYLTGELKYNSRSYSKQGPTHPDYSHIRHFAWIYAKQIEIVDQVLEVHSHRKITVLDLATGSGHFLLTLAKHLAEKNLSSRVRLIGIDLCEDDSRFARELLAASPPHSIDSSFVTDDLECPRFADRLRRYRPDVLVANHVVEHLPGEVQNRYLHDWLFATKIALSISVPLADHLSSSISLHVQHYTMETVEKLARSMEIRVGFAVEAPDIEHTKYGGLCTWLREPDIISEGGFDREVLTLRPKDIEVELHPLAEDFANPFDPAEFAKARRAEKIGEVQNKEVFQEQGHRPRQVRQLLIKMRGAAEIKLPREFAQFEETVQIIIDHNNAVNGDYVDFYAYLNVFRGITEFSSYRGLSLNCHGDQLQSLRTEYAFKPDFSYIVSNTLPTILYEQPFNLTEAVVRFTAGESINLYDYMNSQADERYMYRSDNFGIYLLSPYIVHSAAAADRDMYRVFVKVAFSTKRFFDNRELRRNPAFDYEDWYQSDTVGYVGGWLSHAHWNERFVKEDVCPDWS